MLHFQWTPASALSSPTVWSHNTHLITTRPPGFSDLVMALTYGMAGKGFWEKYWNTCWIRPRTSEWSLIRLIQKVFHKSTKSPLLKLWQQKQIPCILHTWISTTCSAIFGNLVCTEARGLQRRRWRMSHDLLAEDTLFWASLKNEGLDFHLFQLKVRKR